MTLNHLNLTVPDPLATSAFLARHFALRPGGGNGGMQVLYDDQGLVLTLIKGRPEAIAYPPTFHIGFIQPSEQHVNAINQRSPAARSIVRRAEGFAPVGSIACTER